MLLIVDSYSSFLYTSPITDKFCFANAILDRVLHHATVVSIVGQSYRIKHFSKEND
ncbi:ATP-binding protein [Bacillus thuringiensis]|uniref:ATP-binding protein n=1 Tax=Bacillus thuringiensis TaxID=1428 RepID=UPI003F53320A